MGDVSGQAAHDRIIALPNGSAIRFDINDKESSKTAIAEVEVVVSLIPAHLHQLVAKICLAEKKHLLNASYVSDEMK